MKPGPRRSVSQVDIVDAAFEILEQKGFAAVSVRGVAAALGLTPTAIYTYFPSKNALLRAMVEELLSDLDLDAAADPAVAWRDRVHALAAALRARLAEHTGAMVLVTSGPLDGRHALGLNETLIVGFAAEGMSQDDAARAAYAVRAHVLGVAALDAAERVDEVETAADTSTAGALWSDAASHPLTEATAHLVAAGADPSAFTWGVDRLLDGLLAR
ncbi:TetR/AcrR family tetracycline transcriptional repressor [Agromyces hippuratus]|uniref:TetR/AcrR family tetracycline transcriptional repressor n=1 Tax=Agromyces hippuratus TaxID=286438 RepID=A0A852X105_9MICO|nr:helix-turn-helix domain-containing protein [Agromyces hippuratus]NYG21833.1 TetR/AcrR family tetracycline transcriptional repressor [Agromyces hippuratus]